jgi:HEAT repeat protein
MGDARGIEPLILALMDEEASVRTAATRALQRIDPGWKRSAAAGRAVPHLKAALNSREYWVRTSAAEVLALIGDLQSGEGTVSGLAQASNIQRQAAVAALAARLADVDRDVRLAAAEALGRLGDRRCGEALQAALADTDRWVRRAATKTLEGLRWEPEAR